VLIAQIVAGLLAAYALTGFLFAIAFVAVRIHSIDPAASRGTLGFRVIIFPGAAALWPLLLLRWIRGSTAAV